MTSVRWFYAVSAALLALGWMALLAVSDQFRRSWGASPIGELTRLLPLVVFILISLSALQPAQRWLVYASTLSVIPLFIGSMAIVGESPTTALLGVSYFGGWLLCCYRTAYS